MRRRLIRLHIPLAALAVFVGTASAGSSPVADLGTLGGTHSGATAINDQGEVAGSAWLADDSAGHAFSWTKGGGMVDLGTLGGTASDGNAINAGGDVVGVSYTAND